MKHLGEEIIQTGYDDKVHVVRNAARGIIFNDKKEVLFIYSSFYDDVSFPGGGVEDDEDLITTLKRECLEEVGAIIDSYKDFCFITEKRALTPKIDVNVFVSNYYICTCSNYTEPKLLDYEIELGYKAVWMSIDDAIKLNNKTLDKLIKYNKYTGVVQRELRILEELKKISF